MSDASSDLGGAWAGPPPVERDLEPAITALKKGAYLLKYGRRGKPKFCPFRLSNDESILIWFSGKEEKQLRLSHVSRIMPGQRTAIFQRYPRPEKEYKDEAEVWFVGLKTLISKSSKKMENCSRSDTISPAATSPRIYTTELSVKFSFQQQISMKTTASRVHMGSPPKAGLDKAFSDIVSYAAPPRPFFPSDSNVGSVHSVSSGHSDNTNGNSRGIPMDAFRVSLSSAVSSSSHGSGHDDGDALGDVFIWGEGTGEGILGGGNSRLGSSSGAKMDCLVPKPLEFAVRLDVQNISCGGRHAALVSKQGEIYSWGEESGGRLGHGVDCDVAHPKLIDALTHMNIELVACGEYHTCAVTLSGDLYTWGDGAFKFGLLGHGNDVSQWVPKKLHGPLEGIHVSSISCGPWHTAVVTSAGQLFTFGDGSFGVLGHGDRQSISVPREVESLKGLRTVRAACGVWHTAAVVEVMVGNSSSSNCSSGKIFTWGDGDKGRLGHGDKETRLVPTCVASLVEPNFCQVACGHCFTVALTTSGHVYTMGSSVYGQLGNPQADGMVPARVEGKLHKNFVEEISCGAYHVAVLTSRTEVYTWGKGANGRLGHGDTDDRNSPTLVEALKDKQVRSVVCGINFTAAICIHKWVSGVDQSMCSGCRLPFNLRRKRHNCYNCALVFCHSCSSKKSLKASLAPNQSKPYYVVLFHQAGAAVQGFSDTVDEELETRSNAKLSRISSMESFKNMDSRYSKKNKKFEFNSLVCPLFQMAASRSFNPVFGSSKKFFSASVPGSRIASRATSPVSRRTSPPRSTTPTPTLRSLTSAESHLLEVELERTTKQLKEAISIAGEETAKCKAAKEVIKSLTAQLKGMAERLPGGATKNGKLPPLPGIPIPSDISAIVTESLGSPGSSGEQEQISDGSNGLLVPNGLSSVSNKAGHPEMTSNGSIPSDAESQHEAEWVEQD
ncbi:hypothetical protein ZWY2020_026715 [Hordeum vulgare]|nr:hypothetical protein ZWY2020_026715 [Hordeum vulgare]